MEKSNLDVWIFSMMQAGMVCVCVWKGPEEERSVHGIAQEEETNPDLQDCVMLW